MPLLLCYQQRSKKGSDPHARTLETQKWSAHRCQGGHIERVTVHMPRGAATTGTRRRERAVIAAPALPIKGSATDQYSR